MLAFFGTDEIAATDNRRGQTINNYNYVTIYVPSKIRDYLYHCSALL